MAINARRLSQLEDVYLRCLRNYMRENPVAFFGGSSAETIWERQRETLEDRGVAGLTFSGGGWQLAAQELGIENNRLGWAMQLED